MPSTLYLILRSARRARLEGRKVVMQWQQRVKPEFIHKLSG